MGPPGGGRSNITNRMVRHYNNLAYPEMSKNIIRNIFRTMSLHFLDRFSTKVTSNIDNMVEACLNVY